MATKKPVKKSRRLNPTLHGLLIARTLSGTVVRTLLFVVLSAALVLVATVNVEDGTVGAMLTLGLLTAAYFVFDVLYLVMANIRPLHPRLDRVVLPLALLFSLVSLYAPLILVTNATINVVNIWLTAGVVLICILGVRFGLLLASSNK